MNSYKIKSINSRIVEVEWTINGVTYTEKLDIRYIPIDPIELNAELERLLFEMSQDVEPEISAEVLDLVNKKVDVDVIAILDKKRLSLVSAVKESAIVTEPEITEPEITEPEITEPVI